MPLEEAFQLAFAEFEGSMAIGLMAADRPGEFLFGQKGSGQGLFLGSTDESTAVASEMYGVVELTSNYVKAEGERIAEGEVFRLSSADEGVVQELYSSEGWGAVPRDRWQTAEITTRDINRAGYPHFFLKEISESIESVRNTIRGKFERSESNEVRFCLGADTLPLPLVAGLRDGKVRTVCVIGQGTAAGGRCAGRCAPARSRVARVAARRFGPCREGDRVLRAPIARRHVGHARRRRVAVGNDHRHEPHSRPRSAARSLGARHRQPSQLRSGVQVSRRPLHIGRTGHRDVGGVDESVLRAERRRADSGARTRQRSGIDAERPSCRRPCRSSSSCRRYFEKTLEQQDRVAQLAQDFALRRRHWAVVGSGASKIAADEIRIKLSELCYKSNRGRLPRRQEAHRSLE